MARNTSPQDYNRDFDRRGGQPEPQGGGSLQVALLPGIGHMPQRDAPEATLDAIASFVRLVS
jgi:pimeloyl-ACP methyl ester carboxylesterase